MLQLDEQQETMGDLNLTHFQHDHSFGQGRKRAGEARTIIVIAVTAATMVVEITAGFVYGSMALLADGLHMASHAVALSIAVFAYIYARRHAFDQRFSFGTGKVNSLAGFTGAILLALFALVMGWESMARLAYPVEIAFNQALAVAVLGLIVNGASVFILGHTDNHHEEGHENRDHAADGPTTHHDHHHHDHNLRSAYLHVLADALTSFLAIIALLAGKYYGLNWMDPVMGIVGAYLVARWSLGLLAVTSSVLLDCQASEPVREALRGAIEDHDDNQVADLHVWLVGPGIHAAIISIVTDKPQSPEHYRKMIPADLNLVHATIEVDCRGDSISR